MQCRWHQRPPACATGCLLVCVVALQDQRTCTPFCAWRAVPQHRQEISPNLQLALSVECQGSKTRWRCLPHCCFGMCSAAEIHGLVVWQNIWHGCAGWKEKTCYPDWRVRFRKAGDRQDRMAKDCPTQFDTSKLSTRSALQTCAFSSRVSSCDPHHGRVASGHRSISPECLPNHPSSIGSRQSSVLDCR